MVGYRVWRLRRDGRLVSAGVGCTTWNTGVNVARCDARCERVPGGACGCGLYAFHDPPPAPAARLRRHPRVRSAALAALANLPFVTLAGWGCLAALTARGDGPGVWAWWLSLLPAVLGAAALLARQAFGSRWLRPVRVWPLPSVLLLAVPLQFAAAAGVDGLVVEALTWTVAITAGAVVLSGFGRLADPLCLGATTAWVAGLPLVLALVPGQLLLVLGGAALAQFATVFPLHARRLLRGRSTR